MASTFFGLEIGKSGLNAARTNLNVTGHNIANADTVGYTRQRTVLQAIPAAGGRYLINQINSDSMGQGVTNLGIRQIRSAYLDTQYRNLFSSNSFKEHRVQGLDYLEGLFNELSDTGSLSLSINDFYSAVNEVYKDPSSEDKRSYLRQNAIKLTEAFKQIYSEMTDLGEIQNQSIEAVGMGINSILEQLSELNYSIARYENSGQTANDLRDQRNLLLDELSGYVEIEYSHNAYNSSMIDLSIGGQNVLAGREASLLHISSLEGRCLVCQKGAELDPADFVTGDPADEEAINGLLGRLAAQNELVAAGGQADDIAELNNLLSQLQAYVNVSEVTQADDTIELSLGGVSLLAGGEYSLIGLASNESGGLEAFIVNPLTAENMKGGQLGAHLSLRDGDSVVSVGIPYYANLLSELARDLARAVNEVSAAGWSYPYEDSAGNEQVSATGKLIFEDFGGDYSRLNAGNFRVSQDLSESVFNIAASDEEVVLTNGEPETGNALNALKLLETKEAASIFDKFNSLAVHLGVQKKSESDSYVTSLSLLSSADAQRRSVSEVSLDEETTNLIMFQQSYNACARVITAMDDMLDRIINGMGRVGL